MKFRVDLKHYLAAHKDCIYTCEKIDESRFVTAGGDGMLLVWDFNDLSKVHSIVKCDSSIYFIKVITSKSIVIGTNKGELYKIDLSLKKIDHSTKLLHGNFSSVVAGNALFVCQTNGYISKVDLQTLALIETKQISTGHLRCIEKIDDSRFLIGTSSNEIITVNQHLEVLDKVNNAHSDSVFSLSYLGENMLVSGGKDAMLKQWNLNNNEALNEVPAHLFTINRIIKTATHDRIISCSRDKSIKIWDSKTLLLEKVIDRSKIDRASTHSVNNMVLFDNNQLISVGDDRIVRIYEITEV